MFISWYLEVTRTGQTKTIHVSFYLLCPLECVIITRHVGHNRAFVWFRCIYQVYINNRKVYIFQKFSKNYVL